MKFPVLYPGDGTTALLAGLSAGEWPASLPSCPGFAAPLGPPIMLLAGGSTAPVVDSSRVTVDGTEVRHCRFDEKTFVNPDAYAQDLGRNILALRHTVVLLPAAPLARGARVTASVTVNGKATTWSFTMAR